MSQIKKFTKTLFLLTITLFADDVLAVSVGTGVRARAVAIQPSDGKTVAAGDVKIDDIYHVAVARYTTSGVLDTSFSDSGVVTALIGAECQAYDVAIDTSNNVVIAGVSDKKFMVARLNPIGNFDTSLSSSGYVVTSIGSSAQINALALDTTGNIIVAGQTVENGRLKIAVARYDDTGAQDNTFGTNGIVTLAIGTNSTAQDVLIQSDGKILVGGWSSLNGAEHFCVARFNSNGTLDTGFGSSNGYVVTSIGKQSHVNGIALDGTAIIAAGSTYIDNYYHITVARYTTSGALDTSFNTTGIQTIASCYDCWGHKVVVDGNSKLVVVGNCKDKLMVIRLSSTGTMDMTFGSSGMALIRGVSEFVVGADIALDSSDKIIVAGEDDNSFLVSRFTTSGVLDSSFNLDGIVTDPGGAESQVGSITHLCDMKDSGVDGGSATEHVWQTRELNMINGNKGQLSLSNNQFTLEPGIYAIWIAAPAYRVDSHQIRLRNITDSTTVAHGSVAFSVNDASASVTYSEFSTLLKIAKSTTFEVQHFCQTGRATDGLGVASDFTGSSNQEVYTHVMIQKA